MFVCIQHAISCSCMRMQSYDLQKKIYETFSHDSRSPALLLIGRLKYKTFSNFKQSYFTIYLNCWTFKVFPGFI